MKLICTKCNGLGVIRVPISRMTPLHNIAQYSVAVYANGTKWPMGMPYAGYFGEVVAYEKPCQCRDGFVEWDRGRSLVPSFHALEATEKQS